jgi:hypothetical protein
MNRSNRIDPQSRPPFLSKVLSLDIPFFLLPIFFGFNARVIPLRSGQQTALQRGIRGGARCCRT